MADEMTMQAIADQMGLSRQRIEQIIRSAFGKVRRGLYKRGITEYSGISVERLMSDGLRAGNRPRSD